MTGKGLHILFIEDDSSTSETLTRMLNRKGHTVSAAKNAADALTLMEKKRGFDLLISDIGLPESDGWEVFLKLRKIQPGLRAIALTGFGFPTDIKRSHEAGFEIHLTKPVEWQSIEQAILRMFPDFDARKVM